MNEGVNTLLNKVEALCHSTVVETLKLNHPLKELVSELELSS